MNKITLNLLLLYHSTVRNCTISKSASCMDVPWASHAKSAKRADSTVNFESAFDHPLFSGIRFVLGTLYNIAVQQGCI